MARVAKLVLMLASGYGFAIAAPAESQAGIIPWMYDAIFGPVGSMRAAGAGYPMTAAYAPYSAGYVPYSVGYAPYYTSYSSSYAPVTMAQYGSTGSGCSTCSQASYYIPGAAVESACGSSGCGTCGSGNCSSGTCSNCTVNSAPTTNGYGSTGVSGPVPDPNFSSKEEIRRLERKIEELDHREKQTEKFLKRQHDDYLPEQFKPSTYQEEEEVRPRRRQTTIDSDSANPNNFETPINRGRPAPSHLPAEEETQKPIIPPKEDDKSTGKKNEGTTQFQETEPRALNLENRITSRAIAPRERIQIVTKQPKLSIAKSGKNAVKTTGPARNADLARN